MSFDPRQAEEAGAALIQRLKDAFDQFRPASEEKEALHRVIQYTLFVQNGRGMTEIIGEVLVFDHVMQSTGISTADPENLVKALLGHGIESALELAETIAGFEKWRDEYLPALEAIFAMADRLLFEGENPPPVVEFRKKLVSVREGLEKLLLAAQKKLSSLSKDNKGPA